MRKIISPGFVDVGQKTTARLFVTIELRDLEKGKELSITAVEGPNNRGGARGSCGQCRESLQNVTRYESDWNANMTTNLVAIWERWHLNGMNAGSTPQMDWLRANPVKAVYPESHYEKASTALAAAGLNPDADGYKYGSAWKFESVPQEVIEWLFALPDSPVAHPWGSRG